MIICPFCNEGTVDTVYHVDNPDKQFAVCWECESAWIDINQITTDSGMSIEMLAKYLNLRGGQENIKHVHSRPTG